MTFCHCSLAVITENSNLWKIETTAVVHNSAHFECLPIKPGLRTSKLKDNDNGHQITEYSDIQTALYFYNSSIKKDHVK